MNNMFWEIPIVIMQQHPNDPNRIAIQHTKVSIIPSFVSSIMRMQIPSHLTNPDGSPATTNGVKVNVNGEQFIVSMGMDEFVKELKSRL